MERGRGTQYEGYRDDFRKFKIAAVFTLLLRTLLLAPRPVCALQASFPCEARVCPIEGAAMCPQGPGGCDLGFALPLLYPRSHRSVSPAGSHSDVLNFVSWSLRRLSRRGEKRGN